MFVLSRLCDTISVPPKSLNKLKEYAILDEINLKYSGKVVLNAGLAVAAYDIETSDDGEIAHTEGAAYYKVVFRLIVFRPFIGEILTARIRSCGTWGLRVTLHFFSDLYIPVALLPPDTQYLEHERVWVWHYEGQQLFLDVDEEVRVRVVQEAFRDMMRMPSDAWEAREDEAREEGVMKGQERGSSGVEGKQDGEIDENREFRMEKAPYSLVCSMDEEGLGCVRWWQ